MRSIRALPLACSFVASLVGCSTVVGADFEDLRLVPATASTAGTGGSGSVGGGTGGTGASAGAENGGVGGSEAGGSGGSQQAGSGGSHEAGNGGAHAGGGSGSGGAAGDGASAGKGGTNAAGGKSGSGGGGSAGTGGAAGGGTVITPPPERVCGDMNGLDLDSPWPMDGACPTRIGRAAGNLAKLGIPTVPIYKASTGTDDISGVPVIDADGRVYVMTRRLSPNGSVLRIFDEKSAPMGEFPIPNEVPGSVLLTQFGEERSILVSTMFQVRLLDRAGQNVLGGVASTGAYIGGSPVVSGGTVFFVNALGQLHAWRPEGVESGDDHVSYNDGNNDPATQSPGVGPDGTIYFTKMLPNGEGGFLHAVTLSQNPLKLTKKWAVPFEGYATGGPTSRLAIASDGTVVFGTTKALLGFDPDGKKAFSTPMTVGASMPTIVGDRVFHAGSEGVMFCITTKGKKLFESPAGYGASFVATAEGLVSYTTLSPTNAIRSIDHATGVIVQERDMATFVSGTATMIDAAGHPYVFSSTSVVGYGSL